MDIHDITAIDMHSHYNHGARFDSDENDVYKADLPFLRRKADAANISAIACSTFAAVLHVEDVVEENEHLYELSQQYDWLYQWSVIEPRNKETYEQSKRLLKSNKCLGLKIDPPCHNYAVAEFGDDIFSFAAEQGAIVLMHPDSMEYMTGFADKYHDVKIIIAHDCGPYHNEPIAAAKYGNLYTDTSGSASINNNVVELAVSRIGSERILFGTDTYDAGFQRGRIEYAMISDKDKQNILRDNALRLFPNIK